MTICIAAIGTDRDGKEAVVFATDHMVSIGNVGQFDKKIEKYKTLNSNTIAMLSGNPLIFNDVLKDCDKGCDFATIKETIHKNMIGIKDSVIQKQILDIFKIDFNYVHEIMKGPLQNLFVQNIVQSIATFSLKSVILLIGFKNGEAQIAEISESTINDMRDIDFGAIGSRARVKAMTRAGN